VYVPDKSSENNAACTEGDKLIADRDLILRLQDGDLNALGLLYDRHNQLVYRTALAITGDSDAAADLVQDAFMRLYRFISRVDAGRPIEPWLYRTTANLAYTWVKRSRRWLRPLGDIAEWLATGKKQSPSEQIEQNDEWQIIQNAIASLSLNHRIVVVLYYINDLSLDDISTILSVPVGTVKSRLYYGRRALKEYLNTDGEVNFREVRYEFT